MRSYRPALSITNNFQTTSAPSASYTQLTAQPSTPTYQSGKIQYYNSSNQPITLAYGAAGSEQVFMTLSPTDTPVSLECLFPFPNRVSIKPQIANATSGLLNIDFFI